MDTKLQGLVAEILGIPVESVHSGTSTDSESEWDSLRHMNLIFAIEDGYGVRFEDEEIAKLTSVEKIEQSLKQKRE